MGVAPGIFAEQTVRVGRGLLCLPFLLGAGGALLAPGGLPDYARRAGLPHPERLVQTTAGLLITGALLLVSDTAPRTGGALLGGALTAITGVVHDFWSMDDAQEARAHRQAFVANVGLLGGVLVATAHSAGAGRVCVQPVRRRGRVTLPATLLRGR